VRVRRRVSRPVCAQGAGTRAGRAHDRLRDPGPDRELDGTPGRAADRVRHDHHRGAGAAAADAAARREPDSMSLARASTPALAGLAALSLVLYAFAERSVQPVHAEAYRMKVAAMRLMERAEKEIAGAKRQRGIAIDARNDPDGRGVIGPQFSLITTDRG